MNITSNYSITRLFVTKEIKITVDQSSFTLILQPVKALLEDDEWNAGFHIITMSAAAWKEALHIADTENKMDAYDFIKMLLFDLGQYTQYRSIYTIIINSLHRILPQLEIKAPELIVNNLTINKEIWEYIIFLLKLSNGEKVDKPLSFPSEEARQFYLAQKAAEEKISKLRSKGDAEGLMKMMLSVIYSFPSLNFDYLFNQTLAQIQWLQKYAAGAVSYEVSAQALAAGNMKKGKKLDFFIK